MFDSADIYSEGLAEEVLGTAIRGRRRKVLLSTKATFRFGGAANDVGSSRYHLVEAMEGSLRRLGTDYGFVRAGKVRYIGCSNFSGWHLMKSLSVSEKHSLTRYVADQAYYSLVGRHYEWELMPLALDQGVGAVVWSPLGWGRLTGKIRRAARLPAESRLHVTAADGPPVPDDLLYRVVDALDEIANETAKLFRRLRSTGCCNDRASQLLLSALGTKINSRTIWVPRVGP